MDRSAGNATLAAALSTARAGLVMYWRGATLSVLAAMVAVIATVPVMALVGGLDLGPAVAGLDGTWSPRAMSVAAIQRSALIALGTPLLSAVGAVLALAGITIVVSAAARAGQRAGEVGVRRAVGASRAALAAMAGVEAILLSSAVLVGSAGFTAKAFQLATAGWTGDVTSVASIPVLLVVVAFCATFLIGGMFVLIPARGPAVHVANGPPLELYLAGALLSVGLMVVTFSSLLARHVESVAHAGISSGGDGAVIQVAATAATAAERASGYARLLDELNQMPGISVASIASRGTTIGMGEVGPLMTDCGDCSEANMRIPLRMATATRYLASADTFRAVGATISSGRGIENTDVGSSPRVAVVNRALALRHFQYGQPIGRRLQLGGADEWYTVVGVVDEPPAIGFGASLLPRYAVYLSVMQHPVRNVEVLVRGTAELNVADVAQTISRSVAPGTMPPGPVAESVIRAAQLAPLRWVGRWIAVQGWAAWIIAALGTLMLVQVWVNALIPELGIRRAVGAGRIGTFGTVMSRAVATGLGGVACALWFGPALWPVVTNTLQGAPGWDPMLAIRFGVILVAVAAAAALPGAFRATHASPSELVGASDG